MLTTKINYNLSGIDPIERIPIIGKLIITFKGQLVVIQSKYHCDLEYAGADGYLWIISSHVKQLVKTGITHLMVVPMHPRDYTDTTHSHKFQYKKDLCFYKEY